MAIAIADDDNEENHREQPPMKNARKFCARHKEQADQSQDRQERRETRRKSETCNLPIPAKVLDRNPALAKEMEWVEFPRDLIGVPVPDHQWQQHDRAEESEHL